MPKANKSSKKKKYNARFPPARIKKIMQTDEEVGKVAAAVPVIISRSLELFIESLISETAKLTQAKNAKTLSTSHIKQTIKNTRQFDFLCDLVKNVPDHQAEDNGELLCPELSVKKGKGRPRKTDALGPGRKKSEGGNKTSSDEDEEDEDVTEDTESDEESTSQIHPHPSNNLSVQMIVPPGSQAAAPSYLAHSSLQPSKPDSEGALGLSNNNLVLPTAGSVSQDPLTSGRCMPQIFQHPGLPLSGDQQAALLHIQHPNQPFYRMPSNLISSSSLPHFMPSKDSFLPPPSHVSPAVPSPQPAMPASSHQHHHQQQQPIDLTNPSRHNSVKEDDDYD